MKHRKIKSEIAFYLQNFDQIEYREYVDRQTRDCCRIIEKESGNKQHTDYFLNYYVPKVKIYDILSNDGMTKLVNSLYKLSPQKYKVFNVLYRNQQFCINMTMYICKRNIAFWADLRKCNL